MPDPVMIATWKWGVEAVQMGLPMLEKGLPALDAAIAGAQVAEDDPRVDSVGYGGIPDALGVVQLDASVMDGATLACGSVAGVENIKHVAALARLVMEKTPHVMLVGEGARMLALEHGFPLEALHTLESLNKQQEMRLKGDAPSVSHDTVTVLALDQRGNLGGACSTSGLALKRHGRVGDSPIIGAGLYVDNTAGAAGGTGVGEEIVRVCGSTLIIEAMREGRSPQEACERAVARVNEVARRRGVQPARVAFIALDPKGRTGAACTKGTGFVYAVGRGGKIESFFGNEIDVGS